MKKLIIIAALLTGCASSESTQLNKALVLCEDRMGLEGLYITQHGFMYVYCRNGEKIPYIYTNKELE